VAIATNISELVTHPRNLSVLFLNGDVRHATATKADAFVFLGSVLLQERSDLRKLQQNNEIKQSFTPNDALVLFFVDWGNGFLHISTAYSIKVLPLSANLRGGCCALIGPLTSPRFNPNLIQSGTGPSVALSAPNALS